LNTVIGFGGGKCMNLLVGPPLNLQLNDWKRSKMANYILFKKKEFKYEKDAIAWANKEKKAYGGSRPVRTDTVFVPDSPMPWLGQVFLGETT
jgi:hypothetical protein